LKNKTTSAEMILKENIRKRIYNYLYRKSTITEVLVNILCSRCGKPTKIYYKINYGQKICQNCLDKIVEKETNNLVVHQEEIITKAVIRKKISKNDKTKFFFLTGIKI